MADNVDLAHMYAGSNVLRPVMESVGSMHASLSFDTEQEVMSQQDSAVIGQVTMKVQELGSDVQCLTSGQDAESERELEKEQEEEEEQERELPSATPRAERQWDLAEVFSASHPTALQHAKVESLHLFTRNHAPKLSFLPWNKGKVYGTDNFFLTLEGSEAASSNLEDYQRPVDVAIAFPGGELLLLSEREADQALSLFWGKGSPSQRASANVHLVHLTYLKVAVQQAGGAGTVPLALPPTPAALSTVNVAAAQLFAGDTTFLPPQFLHPEVLRFLDSQEAIRAAKQLPYARGKAHNMEKSNLEALCTQAEVRLHDSKQLAALPGGGASGGTGGKYKGEGTASAGTGGKYKGEGTASAGTGGGGGASGGTGTRSGMRSQKRQKG
jgi:hypothetical protein